MLTLETLQKYVDSIYLFCLNLDKRIIALENKERRKTVRAKRPVQQRKGEICANTPCSYCELEPMCKSKVNHQPCFEGRKLSPVA